MSEDPKPQNEFTEAQREKRPSLIGELWSMLRHSGKWWMTPILLALLLIAALVVLGSTGLAPFIYTLF